MRLLLDHSIVGQIETTLKIRKDREFAACRLCGAIFQSWLNTDVSNEEYAADPLIGVAAHIETNNWRETHNKRHTAQEHLALAESGLTFTPEAANKLAPFGLVPVDDALNNKEVAQALLEAPRAPSDDVESSLKGYITPKKEI